MLPIKRPKTLKCMWLLLVFAVCGVFPLQALDPGKTLNQYIRNTWTSRDGLPQNSIQTLIQCRDGYIWMGVQEGLVRFDGVDFVVYDKRNTPALKNQDIRALYQQKNGKMWIGNRSGEVILYYNDRFKKVYEPKEQHTISSITEDQQGQIWIGSAGAGLMKLVYRDGVESFERVPLPNSWVNSILDDDKGQLWIATQEGIFRYNGTSLDPLTTADGLLSNDVRALYRDSQGDIWIGLENEGLNRYRDGKIVSFTQADGLSHPSITSFREDSDRNLWIGTAGGGLTRYTNGTLTDFSDEDAQANLVLTIFEDREKNLWVGGQGGGLTRYADSRFNTYTEVEGMVGDFIWTIVELVPGEIWFSTDNAGISVLKNGEFEDRSDIFEMRKNDYLVSLHKDVGGRIWAGAFSSGLFLKDGNEVKKFTNRNSKLRGGFATSIIEDQKGTIWFGGFGLFYYSEGDFVEVGQDAGVSDVLVNSMHLDSMGTLWLGSDGGLFRYRDGQFKAFTEKDGLPRNYIFFVTQDSRGDIWMATDNAGIVRMRGGRFETFGRAEGLFGDEIFNILEDNQEQLWFSTNRGIYRVSLEMFDRFVNGQVDQLAYDHYDRSDGMKSVECNASGKQSSAKTHDGRLWFPTLKGAVEIDPNNLPKNEVEPPVVIEFLQFDNNQKVDRDQSILPPGSGNFEFHFTALSFKAPNKVQFKYQLEGYDKDWVTSGSRRYAPYSNLKPATYTFKVIAANADGVWNNVGDQITFTLSPYFYQTWEFLSVVIFLTLAFGFSVHRYRLHIHEVHRADLERQVQDRTKAFVKTNDELTHITQQLAENARLAGMAEIATDVLHNISNALNSVNTSSNVLENLLSDPTTLRVVDRLAQLVCKSPDDLGRFLVEDKQGRKVLDALNQLLPILANHQKDMIEEYNVFNQQITHIRDIIRTQLEAGQEQRHLETVSINEVISDVLKMQTHLLRKIDIQVTQEFGRIPPVRIFKSDFMQVLTNLVKNAYEAIKAAPDGARELLIQTEVVQNQVAIHVQDTGMGITKENLERIFSHGFTTKETGYGFGLHYCVNVIKDMGGTLEATSEGKGRGSTFIIHLPLDNRLPHMPKEPAHA